LVLKASVYRENLHHWSTGHKAFCPEITMAVNSLPLDNFIKGKLMKELRGRTDKVIPCLEACRVIGQVYGKVLERIIKTIPAFNDMLKGTV
jgi:hypothetical protein